MRLSQSSARVKSPQSAERARRRAETEYKKRCEKVCKAFRFEFTGVRAVNEGCRYIVNNSVYEMQHHMMVLLDRLLRQTSSIYEHPEAKKYNIVYKCDCAQPSCPFCG